MFGFRTPAKEREGDKHKKTASPSHARETEAAAGPASGALSPEHTRVVPVAPATTSQQSVRRSIGEWEAVGNDPTPIITPTNLGEEQAGPAKPNIYRLQDKKGATITKRAGPTTQGPQEMPYVARRLVIDETKSPPMTEKYLNRVAEARACLTNAKTQLGKANNLKTEIKTKVTQAVERLYQLVKEAELGKEKSKTEEKTTLKKGDRCEESTTKAQETWGKRDKEVDMIAKMEEIMKKNEEKQNEHIKKMEELKEALEYHKESLKTSTYAEVVGNRPDRATPGRPTLHSVVVSSENETETGEEVLEKVRKAMDAKEGWIRVERVRKAKDRKIVMGCRTQDERKKMKDKLEAAGARLVVEEVENKNPLLVLRDVLSFHSDEDIEKALKNQNRELICGLDDEEKKVTVKYRKKARNPLTSHVVLSVNPKVWKRAIEDGRVRIDLQSIRVEDQSPLIQCTRCLAYGHSRRLCKEKDDLCSHCGGQHLKIECPELTLGEAPTCVNCKRARIEQDAHNAFSKDCTVRKRWDALARASVAYC